MHVLVTRPKGKGEALVKALAKVADSVHYQSVIEIKPGPDINQPSRQLSTQTPDILIFVSGFAVEHFICGLKSPLLLDNSNIEVFAVGQSTANQLRDWTSKTIHCPKLETSEGLLGLPQLHARHIEGKNIVIVRGVGGRELLAEQLQSRGAKTDYWQLYQRLAVTGLGEQWFSQWHSAQVDCIVVTSVAILNAIFDNLPTAANGWLKSRKWIVASDRIAAKAQMLGIETQQIYDAKGASNDAILAQLKSITEK